MLKNYLRKTTAIALAALLILNNSVFVFANTLNHNEEKELIEVDEPVVCDEQATELYFELNEEFDFEEQFSEIDASNQTNYQLVQEVETEFGTQYFVVDLNKKQARTLWDVADIIMAGVSWADFFGDASWANFGWAVLDTAALLPILPSSAYIRNGSKYLLKTDELIKFAKTSKGASAINKAMKTFKMSDGITSTARKAVLKYFKNASDSQKLMDAFITAANKGLVASNGKEGIKKLTSIQRKNGISYTHEIKLLNKGYADLRIYGYKLSTGEWIFDWFGKALH